MTDHVEHEMNLIMPGLLGTGLIVEGNVYRTNDRQTEGEPSKGALHSPVELGDVDLMESANWCSQARKNDCDGDAMLATRSLERLSELRDLVGEPATDVPHAVGTRGQAAIVSLAVYAATAVGQSISKIVAREVPLPV